nr:TetR/AcrR family transcriptional regulator [uncultured Cohaesibacter sp.]
MFALLPFVIRNSIKLTAVNFYIEWHRHCTRSKIDRGHILRRKPIQKRSHETRANILEAARKLTKGKLFDDVSTDSIAKESGVAKGTIFAHFGDKNGLLSYLVAERIQTIVDDWREDPAYAESQHELLVSQSMKLINLLSTDRTILQIYLDFSGATSQKTSQHFLEALDALEAKLMSFLEDWKKTSSEAIRTDIAPVDLAAGISAFVTTAAIYRSCGKIASDADCRTLLDRQFQAWLMPGCH